SAAPMTRLPPVARLWFAGLWFARAPREHTRPRSRSRTATCARASCWRGDRARTLPARRFLEQSAVAGADGLKLPTGTVSSCRRGRTETADWNSQQLQARTD